MAHLDGDEQHVVEGEEHRNLRHQRQAARDRVGFLLPVELHQLRIHPLLVVLEALAQADHLRLELAHPAHGRVGLVGQREQQHPHADRQQQDGDAEIAGGPVEEVDDVEHRLRQEPRRPEVDGEVQAVHPQHVLVAVEEADHLGAGEEVRGERDSLPRIYCERLGLVDGLEGVGLPVVDRHVLEAAVERRRLIGNECDEPILVGQSHPAAGGLVAVIGAGAGVLHLRVVGVAHVIVVGFLIVLAEDTQRAVLEDEERLERQNGFGGVAESRDPRVRRERDWGGGGVAHRLGHGEDEVVVDGDFAREREARAVVPVERDRPAGRKGGAIGVPERVGLGKRDAPGRGNPAEIGEKGPRRVAGLEQHDVRALLVRGLVIVEERDGIDAPAEPRDGAAEPA